MTRRQIGQRGKIKTCRILGENKPWINQRGGREFLAGKAEKSGDLCRLIIQEHKVDGKMGR